MFCYHAISCPVLPGRSSVGGRQLLAVVFGENLRTVRSPAQNGDSDTHCSITNKHTLLAIQLVEKHGVQQDLFPSVAKKQLAQQKLKMINQLQSQLDRYMASVLDVLGLPPRELLDFLEYKYTVSEKLSRWWVMMSLLGVGHDVISGQSPVQFSILITTAF